MIKHSRVMIQEWPKNIIMVILQGDEEKLNSINTYELEKELEEFPEGEYLLLRYKEDLSVSEIAKRLGVTHGTARCRIESGIRKISHPLRLKRFCSI